MNFYAKILIVLIGISTILNGANFWLKKSRYLHVDIHQDIFEQRKLSWEQALAEYEKLNKTDPALAEEFLDKKILDINATYSPKISNWYRSSPGLLIINKILKYFVVAAVIFYCFYSLRINRNVVSNDHLLYVNIGYAFLLLITTLFTSGALTTLAGCLTILPLFIGATGSTLLSGNHRELLIKVLIATLVLFCLLAPIEIIRRVQYIGGDWKHHRLSGFMNMPNTMGVYLVCVFSLIKAHYLNHKRPVSLDLLFSITVFICILSTGTFTALIAYGVFMMIFYRRFLFKKMRFFLASICLVFAGFGLIISQSRRDAWNSLLGRLEKYQYYFSADFSVFDYLFGQGLGTGSNLLFQLRDFFASSMPVNQSIDFSTDSTPLLLIIQIGLIGCALFYSLLLKAMMVDKQLKAVYVVFILCSLTINIIEVFPLNIILGLMLAKSFHENSRGHPKKASLDRSGLV